MSAASVHRLATAASPAAVDGGLSTYERLIVTDWPPRDGLLSGTVSGLSVHRSPCTKHWRPRPNVLAKSHPTPLARPAAFRSAGVGVDVDLPTAFAEVPDAVSEPLDATVGSG